MSGVDDIIKAWVEDAEKRGEFGRNPHVGKPFALGDGYLDTPDALRMAFKVLKNAGYVPAQVEALNQLADLKEALKSAESKDDKQALRVQIANKQQQVAVLLEKYAKR